MSKRGLDIELCTRCAIFLLSCHQSQILHTQTLFIEINELRQIMNQNINDYRLLIGTNVAAMKYMYRCIENKKHDSLALDI